MGKVRDSRIAEIVARNVRLIREAKGLTQKELAEKANWRNQSLLNQIEKGHRGMGPQSLRKLAEALEVDPGVFYTENLGNDPMFKEKIGVLESPDSEYNLFKFWLSIIDFRNLQDINTNLPDEGSCIKTFPVLKRYIHREHHTIVAGIVDIDDMIPEYNRGDIICVDLDDNQISSDTDPSRYLCRINNINAAYTAQKVGSETVFMKISQNMADSKILRLDQGFGINVILGKILWEVRFRE